MRWRRSRDNTGFDKSQYVAGKGKELDLTRKILLFVWLGWIGNAVLLLGVDLWLDRYHGRLACALQWLRRYCLRGIHWTGLGLVVAITIVYYCLLLA